MHLDRFGAGTEYIAEMSDGREEEHDRYTEITATQTEGETWDEKRQCMLHA